VEEMQDSVASKLLIKESGLKIGIVDPSENIIINLLGHLWVLEF
jgi:hypothetical protein